MDTLMRSGTIRSIKEVWWDIRPHPDFGTVEIRMFDGIPTLREVGMAAALCQSLVTLFDQQLDRGYTLPRPAAWVVRDNKWRATRYGLDAIIITDDSGNTAPLRDDLYELIRELEPVADRLGCAEELKVASASTGARCPYERQRAIRAGGGTLENIVDAAITELAEDRFVTLGRSYMPEPDRPQRTARPAERAGAAHRGAGREPGGGPGRSRERFAAEERTSSREHSRERHHHRADAVRLRRRAGGADDTSGTRGDARP